MNEQSNVVAVYDSHTQAEEALHKLSAASFDIKKISIIGKGYHTEENVVGYYTTGDRMKSWGAMGAFWGGLWGLLFGAGLFLIPGIGPVLVAGPILAALLGALETAVVVGGLSALTAALVSMGIPKDRSIKYEADVKADKYLLVVHGTAEELQRARAILAETSPVSLETHQVAAA
ncbi:MAG TPA: general stress protein [Acidobacteriaceae bacterium]